MHHQTPFKAHEPHGPAAPLGPGPREVTPHPHPARGACKNTRRPRSQNQAGEAGENRGRGAEPEDCGQSKGGGPGLQLEGLLETGGHRPRGAAPATGSPAPWTRGGLQSPSRSPPRSSGSKHHRSSSWGGPARESGPRTQPTAPTLAELPPRRAMPLSPPRAVPGGRSEAVAGSATPRGSRVVTGPALQEDGCFLAAHTLTAAAAAHERPSPPAASLTPAESPASRQSHPPAVSGEFKRKTASSPLAVLGVPVHSGRNAKSCGLHLDARGRGHPAAAAQSNLAKAI